MILGALCGLGYAGAANAAADAAIGFILIGAIAGVAVIPAIRSAVKLLLATLALAAVIAICYFISQALNAVH